MRTGTQTTRCAAFMSELPTRSGQAGRAHPHLRPEGLSYREGGESALTEEEEEW
jgi:hypothetical protein